MIKRIGFFNRTKSGHKYNASSCTCSLGHHHDSRLEARHCWLLDLMSRDPNKGIEEVRRQVTFPLEVAGKRICGHRVDFVLVHKDGRKVVVESKGFETPEWNIKHKLFLALYPEIEYQVWRK